MTCVVDVKVLDNVDSKVEDAMADKGVVDMDTIVKSLKM